VTQEAIREQVGRILSSAVFADSQRMSRFLRFAVDESLNGNGDRLKEIVIGAEVFDRGASYDPRLDPIVRVEARRLRTKLRAYYEGPGKHDPVILEFPKGQYSPVFRTLSETAPAATATPAPTSSIATIAVLPFSNLSPQPDSSYFSDGMTEELIHALTRIPGLHVVAWNTAAQLRDQQDDVGSIRRTLGVSWMLRGSVRKSGEHLRITAQLIETSTGHYVWSQTWDREIRDIFAIQEEIATSIASTLKLQVLKNEEPRPVNLESYQLCLRARFHTRERTPEGLRRAVACFERAVAIDANSASAWAGLADTYTLIADYGLANIADCLKKAGDAAETALEIDPSSAEAHAALGLILAVHEWRWEDAEKMFRRALELNYGYANTHHWYAVDFLAMLGRLDEAAREIEIARELDPLSSIILEGRALLKTLARKYDDAIDQYNEIILADPSFYKAYTSMGRAYIQKGMFAAAIEKLEIGRGLGGAVPSILGALGEAWARSGNAAEARRLLAELQRMARERTVHSICFALIHLGLGEKQDALTWLERAVDQREPQASALRIHPIYDELRAEPRFQALLSKVRLA
jgi:TolB-like protein/Tfp pilus assembly protein PilF